jgi:hypothetical protein
LQRRLEARLGERLEQVIQRVDFKRADGVLVVGGGKNGSSGISR